MTLIYVKHPSKEIQDRQEKLLASLDEKERTQHALLFNFGNAAYRYHSIEPTQDEYEQWLEGLPDNIRIHSKSLGFEGNKNSFPLRRFANEMRDRGMEEYMKNLLKPQDYEAWSKSTKDE